MLRVQGGVSRNQFPTFDAEFKFAKIQNSHVWWGGGGMVSGNKFPTFEAESKFVKKKKKNFAKNFLSFQAKKCLGIVLDFEYQVVHIYEVYANHKNKRDSNSPVHSIYSLHNQSQATLDLEFFITAHIRRMGEGTVFSLFVSSYLDGGLQHPRSGWGGTPSQV